MHTVVHGRIYNKRALFLEYPHIVHHHSLGENGCIIGCPGPVAAYCNIENEKEITVKRIRVAGDIAAFTFKHLRIVNKEFQIVLLPYQAEYMKLLIEGA